MPQAQSKLSEALASTLLRFKEIDRDTIESLCKRAATLEHNLENEFQGRTEEMKRAASLRQMAQERGKEVTKLKAELSAWHKAENQLSNAYIRLRGIVGALGPVSNNAVATSEDIWRHSEAKASALVKSHTQLQWALRNLLAHTRELDDRGYGNGDGYQSAELEEAIKQADSLVGIDATDTFPIADDVLYRRIEELEVALAAEKAKKEGRVYIGKDMINCEVDRQIILSLGSLDKPMVAGKSERREMSVAENLSALSGKPTPENIEQSPLHRIKVSSDQPDTMGHEVSAAFRKAAENMKQEISRRLGKTLHTVVEDKVKGAKVEIGYLGDDAVNTKPQMWSEEQLLKLFKKVLPLETEKIGGGLPDWYRDWYMGTLQEDMRKIVKDGIADALSPGGHIHQVIHSTIQRTAK